MLWRTTGRGIMATVVTQLGYSVVAAIGGGVDLTPGSRARTYWALGFLQLTWDGLVALPMIWPPFRLYAQNMLALRGEAVTTAAGVAAMLGSRKPEEVQACAQRLFRTVLVSDLSFADLAENSPNPALYARSRATLFGDCDAFVSHSWRDDPDAKWAALQHWRQRFTASHGREPKIW